MSRRETTLTVDKMTCGACARHVRSALNALDGIESIDVDVQRAKVRVTHDADVAAPEELVAALENAGYPAR